jgi:hypothetical protein
VSWESLNLAHLGDRPPVKPTLGGGILYPGKRHVFSGPQESAKTLAAHAISLDVIRAGGTVLLIDFEMGQWDARDRLRELGATANDFERIHYVEPDTPATEGIIGQLLDLTPTLVVIDAAAGAYDLQGLDDNKRQDVERFAGVYVRSFWLAGIATVLIDHVVKNADARGKYAIGSERKVGGADVHLGFEVASSPLTRGGHGVYRIVTHKDRGGWLPRPRAAELELRSDSDTHAITWTFREPLTESDDGWQPTVLMEKVSRWLEQQDEPKSRNEVESANLGKSRDYVRKAMDKLLAGEYVVETAGPRKARMLTSIKPFRTSPDFAATSPGELIATSPTSPSACRRGEVIGEDEVGWPLGEDAPVPDTEPSFTIEDPGEPSPLASWTAA